MKRRLILLLGAGALLNAPLVSAKNWEFGNIDILQTTVEAGKFQASATALKSANVVKTSNDKGPFTVFAPTAEVSFSLTKCIVETLLRPHQMLSILTCQILPEKIEAKQALQLTEANTVIGKKLSLKFQGGSTYLNNSKVIATDMMASDGLIHVTDQVLFPQNPEFAVRIHIPAYL